jgi:hypothetical protein
MKYVDWDREKTNWTNDAEQSELSREDQQARNLNNIREPNFGRNIIVTRKDFNVIAEVLTMVEDQEVRRMLALTFCTMFINKNPRFKKELFLKACAL